MAGEQKLRELAFRLDVPREEVPAFVEGMNAIVRLPVETLLQMLCTLNHLLNSGEMLEGGRTVVVKAPIEEIPVFERV